MQVSSALIERIRFYLPDDFVDVEALAAERPDWNIAETLKKTGVKKVRHAPAGETAVSIAEKAAAPLLREVPEAEHPDTLIVCTQTPDFLIPHCSAILQSRLGLKTTTRAFDINLGCSGFVYGLATAWSFLKSGLSKGVLLITTEVYSRIINPNDKKTYLLFSDAAAATLVRPGAEAAFTFGTDGSKFDSIIYPQSGVDRRTRNKGLSQCQANPEGCFEMDGFGVFTFTLGTVAEQVSAFLQQNGLTVQDVDHFVFHQGSLVVLESLGRKLSIPEDKLVIDLADVGNAASSSIPITVARAVEAGRIRRGDRLCLFGFGIGLSWAGAVFRY